MRPKNKNNSIGPAVEFFPMPQGGMERCGDSRSYVRMLVDRIMSTTLPLTNVEADIKQAKKKSSR